MRDLADTKSLKILFVIRGAEIFHFQAILRALARRGHRIIFLFDKRWTKPLDLKKVVEFAKGVSELEYRYAVARNDRWRVFLFFFRELRTYRRYLIGENQSPFYLKRWAGYLPRRLRITVERKPIAWLLKTNLVGRIFSLIEYMIPPDGAVVSDIRAIGPDAVFASPTNLRFSSCDLEYLKAAKTLHLPNAVFALTWDNLSTKGLLHIIPDRLFVWNETQKKEAVAQHHVPSSRIAVTGTPTFDALFQDLQPSMSREDFCKQYNLKSEDPFILYLGTSRNLAPDERELMRSLRAALDQSSDERMRRMQIVMRPHPANFKVYQEFEQKGFALVPRMGETPDTSHALQLFYDSLFYATAAVGVNTSAMIDAIILGHPVVAFLSPQYKETQSQTQHFQQLLGYDVVERAITPEECVGRILMLSEGNDTRGKKRDDFVMSFIRPRGRDRAVGEIIAEEIESIVQ